MNKYVLSAAMAVALGLASGAAIAGHHEGGKHEGPRGEKMMERIDTDGDGVISKAEFMAKHEEKFTQMDTNGDGSLSKDEMEAAHAKMKDKWKGHKGKMKKDSPAE